ncbi:hypothetical protein CERZMDRAFT_72240, partial [Cercospora zeae-maydis SCOH1-5]
MLCDWSTYDPTQDAIARDIVYPDDAVETYVIHHNPKHQFYYISQQTSEEAWIMVQTDSSHCKGVAHTAFPVAQRLEPPCSTNPPFGTCIVDAQERRVAVDMFVEDATRSSDFQGCLLVSIADLTATCQHCARPMAQPDALVSRWISVCTKFSTQPIRIVGRIWVNPLGIGDK